MDLGPAALQVRGRRSIAGVLRTEPRGTKADFYPLF